MIIHAHPRDLRVPKRSNETPNLQSPFLTRMKCQRPEWSAPHAHGTWDPSAGCAPPAAVWDSASWPTAWQALALAGQTLEILG
jgi:hypothetical protein